MAYFARQYSPSPVLTMSPQPAHQSLGMASFPRHSTASRFGNMNQFASPTRPTAGRKRSREEASTNLEPDVKSIPVEAPEEEWVYGPGMVLIKSSARYVSDASTQSGTWLDEKNAEEASERRAADEQRAVLRNPKLQRTVAPVVPVVAPVTTSKNTTKSSPDGLQGPVIDDFTMHLGIGWRKISDAEHIQAAARGWARYIENHYPVTNARILLESNGLQSYLVEASEGFFLFAENLRKGQLVSHTADGALRNLQCSPPNFEGMTTMEAAESPRPIDTDMNMD